MLNKTDKYFFISLGIFIFSFFVLPILMTAAPILDYKFLFDISLVFSIINCLVIVPILFLNLIVIFIIKLFSKNKNIKDWIIILLNLLIILFSGFIMLIGIAMSMAI